MIVHAKNYETVFTFVKVMQKKTVAFFPDTMNWALRAVVFAIARLSCNIRHGVSQLISVTVFKSLSHSTVTPLPFCLEEELVHLEKKHH